MGHRDIHGHPTALDVCRQDEDLVDVLEVVACLVKVVCVSYEDMRMTDNRKNVVSEVHEIIQVPLRGSMVPCDVSKHVSECVVRILVTCCVTDGVYSGKRLNTVSVRSVERV